MEKALRLKLHAKEDALASGGSWASLLFYCALTIPFFLYAVFVWKEAGPIMITGLFAGFGVLGLVMMLRLSASMAKFGEIRLWLERKPAVGGRLEAKLDLDREVAGLITVRANLVCSEVTYKSSKNGQKRNEKPLRGVARSFPIRRGDAGPRATIVMDIPANLPPANDPGMQLAMPDQEYIAWELKIVSEVPGIDLERSYELTVGPAEPGLVLPPLEPERPLPAAAMAAASAAALRSPAPKAAPARPAVRVRAPEPEVEPEAMPVAPPAKSALWLLVLLNFVPLLGVWAFGWKVRDVVMLYWFENLVIGFFNLARIAVAQPASMRQLRDKGVEMSSGELAVAKTALGMFFLCHYGAFCFAHAEALASVFSLGGAGQRGVGVALAAIFDDAAGAVAVLGLILVHAYSFLRNYLGREEYRQADLADLMTRPYKRVFVVHLFVIAGGLAAVALGDSRAVVVVFIAIKIGVDAWAHRSEHRMALEG
jgi:hypothetical protein